MNIRNNRWGKIKSNLALDAKYDDDAAIIA
jgi:hypothetical protein